MTVKVPVLVEVADPVTAANPGKLIAWAIKLDVEFALLGSTNAVDIPLKLALENWSVLLAKTLTLEMLVPGSVSESVPSGGGPAIAKAPPVAKVELSDFT